MAEVKILIQGYAKDEKALKQSRKKVLEMADYIIPGHGGMFKNHGRNK